MKNYLLAFLGGKKIEEEEKSEDKQELVNSVHAAQREWQAAQTYFESVSEPELVDYAIYKLETARRKYMYLLNLAKKEGLEDKGVLYENREAAQS
jgi:hypothetical protein